MLQETISCENLSCQEINTKGHYLPEIKINFDEIKIVMIAEAYPENPDDYFYSKTNQGYMKTTLQAFHDAGLQVNSIDEIIQAGFYLTAAVKCAKIGYGVPTQAIKNCSIILEKELALFPNKRGIMLMGDVAIKAINYIARRTIGKRVIPAGSTYKIRKKEFYFNDLRLFPSYLMTGKNYLIEKAKRKMIAEDIANAWEIIKEARKEKHTRNK